MNAVDHPHGGKFFFSKKNIFFSLYTCILKFITGGKKCKGGKAPRSPWGWKTKGPKTVKRKKWYVVLPRWKAKKLSA